MEKYIQRKISKHVDNEYYHKFYDKKGNELLDKKYIDEIIEGIYIPPAYNHVKISLHKNAKVRAIGYDLKCRPQYIYNKSYIDKQSDKKFNHMKTIGKKFSKINKQINRDLNSNIDSKDKQIALILKLIMECHFRVGNDKYLKDNKSYGTTTLKKKHLSFNNKSVTIDFIGKKSVRNTCTVRNKRLVKELTTLRKKTQKNDRVFTYKKGRQYHSIRSSDVNKYLKQFGKDITTKNFRTWGANIEFIIQIIKNSKECQPDTKKNIENIIKTSIKEVAFKLHNTPGVCRSNYLDPELIKYFKYDCEGFLNTFLIKKKSISKATISRRYVYFLEEL